MSSISTISTAIAMKIPDTPLEEIPKIHSTLVSTFRSHKTLPLEYRLDQLRKLYFSIIDNKQNLINALHHDLHRPPAEADTLDILTTLSELVLVMGKLPEWIKDQHPSSDLLFGPMSPTVRSEPLGTVLIISPWNYPIFLSLPPLIGAIAAGNTAIIKMSEHSPACSAVVSHIVHSALDQSAFRVITGALPQATALTELKHDLIFYTGSGRVGTQIAITAAKTLTPTVLELGGKSPAIVCSSANIKYAAARIAYGKLVNGGQTCVAPDYVLLPRGLAVSFLGALKTELEKLCPGINKAHADYSHLINDAAFNRIVKMINTTKGEVVIGGTETADPETKYVPLTVILDVRADDSTMQDEIFGPVLPIVLVDSVDEAVSYVNDYHDTPLALYIFSESKAEQKLILDHTRSGGAMINGTVLQVGCPFIPFGGVGSSGYGSYHGRYSFDVFSHQRSVVTEPKWTDIVTNLLKPPYTTAKLNRYKLAAFSTIWFNRTDPIATSILGKLFGRIAYLWRIIFRRC